MEEAWLEELSEDWISQPRSGSPASSLPSLSNSTSESNSRIASSRIPKYNSQKQGWAAPIDSSNSPLSERSVNEYNIPPPQRASRRPSKLRQVTNSTRGRHPSRTLSASSTQSVQHHTIQHKSHSLSPKKGIQDTPEWRRRLLNGDVAYGEQRDLFSPAGLESIFQPPPAQAMSPNKSPMRNLEEVSIMPSSPPPYNKRAIAEESAEESSEEDRVEKITQDRKQPRGMKYRLADEGSSFSGKDLSRSSSFQPPASSYQNPTRVANDSEIEAGFSSSVVNLEVPNDQAGRTVSGQSVIRNEELSPIYVARHNTVDGKIDYAALDLPGDELQRRLEEIREDSPVESTEDPDEASEVSRDDMTVGTDDFAHNGGFINLRRGGHSQEGSFQKRMLSPSSLPAIDESILLPEESMQASTPKQLPNIKKTRESKEHQSSHSSQLPQVAPETPHESPEKSSTKPQNAQSGSPLKLFGTYDTFTNQKLLRRLSQFEGAFEDPENEDVSMAPGHAVDDASYIASSLEKSKRITSFGEGDLNTFQFSEDISFDSTRMNQYEDDKETSSLPVLDPRTQTAFKFELDPSALESNVVVRRKTQYSTTTNTSRHIVKVRRTARPGTSSSGSSENPPSQTQAGLNTPRKKYGDSESKRMPKSPLKDSTPKRRRTLRRTEMQQLAANNGEIEIESINEAHHKMMSVIGRKRKDARHGDDQQAANPKVLAMRQILRPRTPTPSQRSSQMQERDPLQELDIASVDHEKIAQDKKIARIQAELDATEPLRISALGVSQQMQNDSRKGSVTTQDFLDDAKKIMAVIRGKARPHSGLTSLEESESENDRKQFDQMASPQEGELEDSYQESTKEPFSRPPSREGGAPLPRLPKQQEDPALLDHLRKYQEKSDLDGVIASSMKSIAMAKEAAIAAKETDRLVDETISRSSARLFTQEHDVVASDPPNIRISENPDANRKRKHSTSSAPNDSETHHEDDFPSHGSNVSSNQSTSRSIPTGSSRGSDSRRVIAPHTVSHLIPEQLAGMVFDRERNKWVKRRNLSAEDPGQNFLPSDETEEDPFGDIPDLSVDESQEMQRIKAAAAKRKEEARVAQEYNNQEQQQKRQQNSSQASQYGTIAETKEDFGSTEDASSPEPEARKVQTLSAWENENLSTTKSTTNQKVNEKYEFRRTETQEEVIEEVEREISIHEDRIYDSPPRRRNVTISFSSPLASVIEGPAYEDEGSIGQGDADESELSDDGGHNGSILVRKAGGSQNLSSAKQRKPFRSASRRVSLGGHNFSARPVSRIDERDEESSNENEGHRRRSSVSLVVSTTGISTRQNSLLLATPRPAHEVGTLTLTPLSDFTVHQADQSLGLDVSYVAQKQRFIIGKDTRRSLSLSIKDLVEKITEVEPYEPFWEHIRQMELKDKRLANLHKLDEFCEQLEELDVSHNQICHLDGIPRSVRFLNIAHNRLSDLTAWGHLMNLQYVDISNNEIESLSAFKFLIHMRSLRADNNKITSLEGIDQLDGLLSLRIRGNSIQEVNFRGTKLHRLTDLDLQDNHISRIEALHDLRSLTTLNLMDNHLSEFTVLKSEELLDLKYLKLSGNNLESLDVSQYPNLRLLYLDRNRLGTVTGLLKTKYLDSLSMREQQQDSILNLEFLAEAFEVRKLFLSGNLLDTFEPPTDFLNLQYLELANCGLESLPDDFGVLMANLRVLNLNFNALKDVTPILGIVRLKKLHLAGNRIDSLKMISDVFAHFSYLTLADLRGNPLTIGFYPSIMETQMVVRNGPDEEIDIQEPYTLAKANKARDDRYFNCLDMETRIKRRLYDLYIVNTCTRMKLLDGLETDLVELSNKKDKVFDEMVKLGYLIKNEHAGNEDEEAAATEEVEAEPEEEPVEEPVEEERWEGEDSFA